MEALVLLFALNVLFAIINYQATSYKVAMLNASAAGFVLSGIINHFIWIGL